jgi:CHAT domain-containing protein
VTWCLAGPLTFLPLHAAGIYDRKAAENPRLSDFVVSSYTPSLSALLDANERHSKHPHTTAPRLLAISQSKTPGQAHLPGVVREVESLRKIFPGLEWLDGEDARRTSVLGALKKHRWAHFACHAIQNTESPANSAFLMHDAPLELFDIMRSSFSHAELAVLSACQTATGDTKLPQEAVHLAAGMLFSGYSSVVATMWSINDDDGPLLARELYSHLVGQAGGDVRQTAYALHHAVKILRDTVGETEFVRWVPFIHLGL